MKNSTEQYCPVCASEEIQGNDTDHVFDELHVEMFCMDCDATWNNIFKLAGYVTT